jgi:hypothetical protein
VASYKKRDLNRFTKVYPYVRFPPRFVYEYDSIQGGTSVEAGKINFVDAETGTYSFTSTYASVPSVTITSVDTVGNFQTNVSLTITAITTTSVTVSSSAKFTGQVHVHVVPV